MKVNLDDPNLTAFALGELSPDDHARMADAIASSPEAQSYVSEIQQFAGLLRAEYEADRRQPLAAVHDERVHVRSAHIIRMEEERRSWSRYQWGSLAAVLAIFAVIAGATIMTIQRQSGPLSKRLADNAKPSNPVTVPARPNEPASETTLEAEPGPSADIYIAQQPAEPQRTAPAEPTEFQEEKKQTADSRDLAAAGKTGGLALNPSAPPPPILTKRAYDYMASGGLTMETAEAEPPSRYRQDFNTATYDRIEENPFLPAATNPLSTFSIDVDTASYSNVRRFINSGSLPPKDAVRVEEMINYFSYNYREPEGDKPFSIDLDATACPWDPSHRLLRIGLKGRDVANEKRPASNLVFLLD
ncbi:MAG TPA: von Willebrand factor type A domain-containing protein, partial [Chthoniobacterales bacterium]